MKKEYIKPEVKDVTYGEEILGLVLDSDGSGNVTGTIDEGEYDGEFTANQHSVWDEEL